MIKLITETYNGNDEVVLRIEYDTDKEIELIKVIRDNIDDLGKIIKDKELEWDLIGLKLDICFDFTLERINEIKNTLNKVKVKDNEKVKVLENLIFTLIEMKQHWKKLKEKFKEKTKTFDFGDILYIHL
jgi:hypothetical protein